MSSDELGMIGFSRRSIFDIEFDKTFSVRFNCVSELKVPFISPTPIMECSGKYVLSFISARAFL